MQIYEHKLFLNNESKVQKQLQEEGMIFVEVDKNVFMENGEKAIYESLSPQMQEIYKTIKKLLNELQNFLSKFLKYGTLLTSLGFIITVSLQIFARFFLSDVPPWTEEASRFCLFML